LRWCKRRCWRGLAFEPFALFDGGCGPADVSVGQRHVGQNLVVAPVVVVLDAGADLSLQIVGQEVVLQQDGALHGLVTVLDLTLGLWMHRRAADIAHGVGLGMILKFGGDTARAVVAQKARFC
jgi:hypothetical protein